jgi:TetR/AcrR family transcriptional regulator
MEEQRQALEEHLPPKTSSRAGRHHGRMAGDDRRLQILGVAVRLFSQRGFRGTTTKEIAHEAGVSEAMVFRHFANKEELYSAILDHKACTGQLLEPRQLLADAVERKDDRAVFERLALASLNHHEQDKEFHRLLLYAALDGHQLAQMFWERIVLSFYDFLGSYIRQRQRDGALIQLEPNVVVRAFVGMIIHHSLNNNLWDRGRKLLNVSNEAAARHFTNILLDGISTAPPLQAVKADAPVRAAGRATQKGARVSARNRVKR